jgi:hypothetical protein
LQALLHIQPICGKVDVMETYLKRCQNVTVNDRKKALEDHDAYKENNPSRE